jgi:rhodanese-related sulfurtransferase
MIKFLKLIFGFGPQINYAQLVKDGAIIVDVRSISEYAGGHIKGSINIPVTSLNQNLSKLKNKEAVIITCCASGMRSASAKGMLKANGYTSVHNGGGWMNLKRKI